MPPENSEGKGSAMTTENELFPTPTHRHVLKDIVLVTLVAGITFGFLAQVWKPSPAIDRASVTPAVAFAG